MTVSATTTAHRVPGHLVWNPTTGALSGNTAANYGGTLLGLCEGGIEYDVLERTVQDVSREDGGHVFDLAIIPIAVLLRAKLLQRETAVPRAFPSGRNTTDGNGKVVVQTPGSDAAGAWLAGSAGKLLFVPSDETYHPFVLLRKAIGHVVRMGPLAVDEEHWLEVEFVGLPDTSYATTAQRVHVDALKAGVTV
jgi:hypothetical protein